MRRFLFCAFLWVRYSHKDQAMKLCAVFSFSVVVIAGLLCSETLAVTVQTAANVFHGHPFLYVEGESASAINGVNSWRIVNKGGPEMSVNTGTPVPIMPTTTNASGNSAINAAGNDFGDTHNTNAIYQVQFITPGFYQFYPRMSLYDSNNNTNFLNEDSVYLSPGINK